MSDDNYDNDDDELPAISISNAEVGCSLFTLPSAEVLAHQRVLEAGKEMEIEDMRRNLDAECKNDVRALFRTDSSGSSECESALKANLESLRLVDFSTAADDELTVLMMIEKMITVIPKGNNEFYTYYVECLKNKSKQEMDCVDDDIITSLLECCLSYNCSESEWLGMSSWCSVMVAADTGGLRVRRLLQYLLDTVFSYKQILKLYDIIRQCIKGSNRLLKVSSAYRSGTGRNGDLLSNAILRFTLITTMDTKLKTDFATDLSTKWLLSVITVSAYKELNPRSQLCIVLIVGRALSYQDHELTNSQDVEAEANDRERLFEMLAKKRPKLTIKKEFANLNEQLMVGVAASKLKLLFTLKNVEINEPEIKQIKCIPMDFL